MKLQAPIVCRFALAFLACIAAPGAGAQDGQGAGWFRPYLELNEEPPICESLLEAARQRFASTRETITDGFAEWSPLLGAVQLDQLEREDPAGSALDGRYFVTFGGKRVYLAARAQAYGGLGDTQSFYTALKSFRDVPAYADRSVYEGLGAPALHVPQYSYSWLKTAAGAYYVGYADDTVGLDSHGDMFLVRLGDDGSWRNVCRIVTRPPALDRVNDAHLRAALAAVRAFDAAAAPVLGGEGDCGTMHALGFRYALGGRVLEEALVRPWAVAVRRNPFVGRVPERLSGWAASGLYERAAFEAYGRQKAATAAALASFYVEEFGWETARAESMGGTVMDAYSESVFAFPEYVDPLERGSARELRAAILAKRPVEELRKIAVDLKGLDGVDDRRGERVLNVAVTDLDALRYLLDLGADPNKPNAFGKTPLMYAAQHNAYEAALLLLDRGASANAWTRPPNDSCYYNLQRTGVTPLHYAVRYASTRFVKLLLERGAAVYVAVSGDFGSSGYPVDWLSRYVTAVGDERNANIDAREIPDLRARLALPSAADIEATARQLTLRAEADYAAGRVMAAYSALALALKASPSNPRTLGDMSLVAVRAGEPGDAAEAALDLAHDSVDSKVKAGAWFNYGLACDALRAAANDCRYYSAVLPYLRSWLFEPSAARAAKVVETMTARATCTETKPDGAVYRYLLVPYTYNKTDESPQPQRLYVMHPISADVPADSVRWPIGNGQTATVRFVARHDLGAVAITLFDAAEQVSYPVSIGAFSCSPPASGR